MLLYNLIMLDFIISACNAYNNDILLLWIKRGSFASCCHPESGTAAPCGELGFALGCHREHPLKMNQYESMKMMTRMH